jgi:hypothetical protein
VKLDGLCGLVTAQLGGEAKGAIDASGDACSKDPRAVDISTLAECRFADSSAGLECLPYQS